MTESISSRTGPSPIADEGVTGIGELYRIEADLGGPSPEAALLEGRNDQRR